RRPFIARRLGQSDSRSAPGRVGCARCEDPAGQPLHVGGRAEFDVSPAIGWPPVDDVRLLGSQHGQRSLEIRDLQADTTKSGPARAVEKTADRAVAAGRRHQLPSSAARTRNLVAQSAYAFGRVFPCLHEPKTEQPLEQPTDGFFVRHCLANMVDTINVDHALYLAFAISGEPAALCAAPARPI